MCFIEIPEYYVENPKYYAGFPKSYVEKDIRESGAAVSVLRKERYLCLLRNSNANNSSFTKVDAFNKQIITYNLKRKRCYFKKKM